VRVDTLYNDGDEMLQLEHARRLCPDMQRRGRRPALAWRPALPHRPLNPDWARYAGKLFANNLVPIQNQLRETEPPPCEHGINDWSKEFAKRARPRHFCTKMISHSPL
jgi:hypothetical protein